MKYSFNGFSNNADFALNLAVSSAQEFGHSYIGSEHLLLGLCLAKDSHACTILLKNGITAIAVELQLLKTVGRGNPVELTPEQFTPRAKKVVENALSSAACENRRANSDMLLYSLINESDNYAVKYIKKLGGDVQVIRIDLNRELQPPTEDGCTDRKKSGKREGKTPFLEKYAIDLTKEAVLNKLDGVIGREKEMKRVMQILCRRNKNNPCLIGEPGVGKTAVIEGLAVSIANGTAPLPLSDKKIMMLDLTSVVAGTKYRGDFEERIKNIVDEVKRNEDVLLFIDELHNLVGAGSAEGSTDAANILKPSLARGDFRLIGATTNDEYKKYIESDAALERRFQPVAIEEPTVEETIEILRGIADKYQKHHNVIIEDEALAAAAKYADRYIQERFLPDKAIDLVDETAARIALFNCSCRQLKNAECANVIRDKKSKSFAYNTTAEAVAAVTTSPIYTENHKNSDNDRCASVPHVTAEDIAKSVSDITSIPITKLSVSESEKLNTIENELSKRVIGQNEAVSTVARVIKRARSGFADCDKPLGSMIFAGPPGVGKTELCRCLAELMFGSPKALIKFDMSEYSEPHSVSKLIGSPPGYVGYGSGGKLTDAVRKHPYSIVLFDEIEKADSEICNLFLQILDDGKLSDSSGRTVNFRNTVVVMTSNIGSELLKKNSVLTGFNSGGTDIKERKNTVVKKLAECYKQELIDRVDDIVIFNPLGVESMEAITGLMLQKLKAKVNLLGIDIGFSHSAVKELAQLSSLNNSGARNIRRTIVKNLETPLSEEIINSEIKKGDRVNVVFAEDGFKFLTA